MTSTGEPFHFLPTAPDVLFCKGSPPMKKVIMTVQPDLLQSASKRRQTSANIAPPRVLTKKRKMITRRIIKKPAPASPSPSESNTNQVIHLFLNFFFIAYTHTLVHCNSILRTWLKTSPTQDAQYNMRWLQIPIYWQRQTKGKLTQSMFLTTQALLGRSLLNRPMLLLQNR